MQASQYLADVGLSLGQDVLELFEQFKSENSKTFHEKECL